jgi:hypothetical protein
LQLLQLQLLQLSVASDIDDENADINEEEDAVQEN